MVMLLLIMFSVFTVMFGLVVFGTFAKNRWGINLEPIRCPRCGHATSSTFRRPTSLQQALWGGKTCPACGTEADKWGRQINSSPK
jgi:ribosomal protein S27AE